MKKIGPGEYDCTNGELIQINFFCSPHRSNVNIRSAVNGGDFHTVTTNSIKLVMDTSKITVEIQYAFINAGSCLNQIVMVSNSPTKDDRIPTGASAGGMDFIALNFNP